MSLVLGIKDKRIILSKEALGNTRAQLTSEVKKWLNRGRLLGAIEGPLSDYDLYIELSDKSHALCSAFFERRSNARCYFSIFDDTEVVVPKFINKIEVFVHVPVISLDLQRYADTKCRNSRCIIIARAGFDSVDIKLKTIYKARIELLHFRRVYTDIEGVKDKYNSVVFDVHGNGIMEFDKVENAMMLGIDGDPTPLIYNISPEQAEEFISLCREHDYGIGSNWTIDYIQISKLLPSEDLCILQFGYERVVSLSLKKAINFLYNIQRTNIKQLKW